MSVCRFPEDIFAGKHLVSIDVVKAVLSGHCFHLGTSVRLFLEDAVAWKHLVPIDVV